MGTWIKLPLKLPARLKSKNKSPIRSHRRATRCKPTFAPIRRLPTYWNSKIAGCASRTRLAASFPTISIFRQRSDRGCERLMQMILNLEMHFEKTKKTGAAHCPENIRPGARLDRDRRGQGQEHSYGVRLPGMRHGKNKFGREAQHDGRAIGRGLKGRNLEGALE